MNQGRLQRWKNPASKPPRARAAQNVASSDATSVAFRSALRRKFWEGRNICSTIVTLDQNLFSALRNNFLWLLAFLSSWHRNVETRSCLRKRYDSSVFIFPSRFRLEKDPAEISFHLSVPEWTPALFRVTTVLQIRCTLEERENAVFFVDLGKLFGSERLLYYTYIYREGTLKSRKGYTLQVLRPNDMTEPYLTSFEPTLCKRSWSRLILPIQT